MLKIINIIPYISSKYGGPPYVAKSLNKLFNKTNNFSSKLLTLEKSEDKNIVSFRLTSKKFWFSYDFMINSIRYIRSSDVVFAHGIYNFPSFWGSLIGYVFGKKIFLLPHGMLDKNSINSSNFLKNSVRKLFLYTIGLFQVKVSKKIIFNSQKEKDNSLFNQNSVVIPNGVDLEYIDSIKFNKNYFDSDKISLFFLGRLNKIKGIELIFEAINELDSDIKNKIELIIAGTGDEEYVKYLQNMADKDIVKFIGHIEGDEKYCYLKQCDIYLQPSFTEGLSISMLEAMACKVNMITTNRVGLYEELIENRAAMVIKYNKSQLKSAIIDIINKKINYKEKAYYLVQKKYNWEVIIKYYEKLIKQKGEK